MEILVSMAILIGISGILVATLRMGQQSWQVEQSRMAVSHELRRGIDAMARELAESGEGQVDIPADGDWYGTLRFEVPEDLDGDGTVLDSDGELEWSPEWILYTQDAADANGDGITDQVIRTQGSETPRVIANGLWDDPDDPNDGLRFRRDPDDSSIVEIALTVRRGENTGDFPNTATLSTTVQLRNE